MKGGGVLVNGNASAASQANRWYWQTEQSVADIAEKLSVSRRALYELITPESAGAVCTECGGDMVYVNRSAKASSLGRCSNCGAENTIAADVADDEDDNHVLDVQETVPPYAAGWPRPVESSSTQHDLRTRALTLGGVALAGAALGALAAVLVTRRR
jgi:hypothetical protein